ncbi:NrfD/PsrC family molybdoenzyme membrane anchor subunit [Desulfitobacterium sp.]|uniref:NrfD/PsrC family molybdoenzyme membrane anchor subunit n=1 Tax=Desulfitobacterium sp. TaxID=49981 RepID=UPI002B1EE9AB|nr:NrfD/PsrC family molybdoenzyme membrane anchor subunit [Desulfitobacterium sp.]MEA4901531.1 NrfD/PsrC family molybdoenzyme membrane anchor subunit [Desulfitobacterium sp.]
MSNPTVIQPNIKKKQNLRNITWTVILCLVIVAGIVAWGYLTFKGTTVTNLNNINPWGVDIASFMLFMSISAGALIIASLPGVMNITRYQSYAKIPAFIGLAASIGAGAAIFMHLGRPERFWHMIVYLRLGSPMSWDSLVIALLLIISAIFLNKLIKFDQGKTSKDTIKKLSYCALFVGLLEGGSSFTYSLQASHTFWNSPAQPVAFIITAIIAGTALLTVVLLLLKSRNYLTVDDKLSEALAKITGVSLITELIFVISEIITGAYPGTIGGLADNSALFTGAALPYFRTELVVVVAAIVIFLTPSVRRNSMMLSIGGVLAIIGVFLNKLTMLVVAFSAVNITNPGAPTGPLAITGSYVPNIGKGYFPSLVECTLVLSIVALVILLLLLGFKYLPLQNKETV